VSNAGTITTLTNLGTIVGDHWQFRSGLDRCTRLPSVELDRSECRSSLNEGAANLAGDIGIDLAKGFHLHAGETFDLLSGDGVLLGGSGA
jgi:hypothetical protein